MIWVILDDRQSTGLPVVFLLCYILFTDIAKYKNPDNAFIVVVNRMRNHSTISFLGLREQIHNPILNLSNSIGLKQNLVIMFFR